MIIKIHLAYISLSVWHREGISSNFCISDDDFLHRKSSKEVYWRFTGEFVWRTFSAPLRDFQPVWVFWRRRRSQSMTFNSSWSFSLTFWLLVDDPETKVKPDVGSCKVSLERQKMRQVLDVFSENTTWGHQSSYFKFYSTNNSLLNVSQSQLTTFNLL